MSARTCIGLRQCMELSDAQMWHVIWTTFQTYPPTDSRGDWRALSDFYSRLGQSCDEIEMSSPLPTKWQAKAPRSGQVVLPLAACAQVDIDIRNLTDGDRVAELMTLRATTTAPDHVQLVGSCPAASLHQVVGRLKSRTATLLSFREELGVGGAGTWGRGFWWAGLPTEKVTRSVIESLASGRV